MTNRRKQRETDSWIKNYWRSAMAWQYFMVCLFDFMLAPIMLAIYSHWTHSTLVMWQPLTLQGAGLYHLSMGAIIGVTSYAKSQERIKTPLEQLSTSPQNDPDK